MSASAQRKAIRKFKARVKQESAQVWCLTKHRWYKWGKGKCMKYKLKDPVWYLLETLISLCNLNMYSQATVQAILTKYNNKHANQPISRATFYRYLDKLIKLKLIKRYEQTEFNKPVITRLLAPKLAIPSVSSCEPDKFINKKGAAIDSLPPCYNPNKDPLYEKLCTEMLERSKKLIDEMRLNV